MDKTSIVRDCLSRMLPLTVHTPQFLVFRFIPHTTIV